MPKPPADKKPDLVDVLALLGVVCLVAGVWVLFSMGHALVTAGAVLLFAAIGLYLSRVRPWVT